MRKSKFQQRLEEMQARLQEGNGRFIVTDIPPRKSKFQQRLEEMQRRQQEEAARVGHRIFIREQEVNIESTPVDSGVGWIKRLFDVFQKPKPKPVVVKEISEAEMLLHGDVIEMVDKLVK